MTKQALCLTLAPRRRLTTLLTSLPDKPKNSASNRPLERQDSTMTPKF